MAAIKEKNLGLYRKLISPDLQKSPAARSQVAHYWGVAQRSFAKLYVHAEPVKVGPVTVAPPSSAPLAPGEKRKKVEKTNVWVRLFDEKGKQARSLVPVPLRRVDGGRWYIASVAAL